VEANDQDSAVASVLLPDTKTIPASPKADVPQNHDSDQREIELD